MAVCVTASCQSKGQIKSVNYNASLTARAERVTMDTMRTIVDRNLPCQLDDCSFRCAITGSPPESYQSHDTGCVDNPASVSARMRLLLQHLPSRVLASQKDTSSIDSDRLVERLVGGFVDKAR